MKTASFFLLFLLGIPNAYSQSNWGIEGSIQHGFLTVHRPSISHLPKEVVFSGELSYFLDLKEKDTWASNYETPRIGCTTFFHQTGNTPILGHLFGAFAFGDLPFFRNENHSFSARIGTGIAIATKVYDPIDNPKNNAISSNVNVIVKMALNYRRYLDRSEIGVGVSMNHFSNGSNKLPNLGLNYPMLTLSYGRTGGSFKAKSIDCLTNFQNTGWKFGANGIFSVKETFPTGGKKYPIFAISGIARKIFSPKVGVEIALDGIYKTAILDYLKEYEKRPIDIIQGGIFVGHVLTFDRFSTILGMGAYFWDRFLPEDRVYHRIGMRYSLKNNIQLGITLKSNWGKADYVEWSIGYLFKNKKS